MDTKGQMRALLKALQDEKAAILKDSAPHRAKYEAARKKIQQLEAEAKAHAEAFHAVERPRMAELERQIGTIAKALGGKSLGGA
jgi:predicted nuclease with TOPRIM domain